MKKHLILDWSPILYGNLFGATSEVKKNNLVSVVDGKYNLDEYKDIVIFKIFEEISKLKNQFNLSQDDEIIIATDTPGDNGYWRKKVWEGYKAKRKSTRDDSDIQWDKAFKLFQEINETLDKCSSMKVISVPETEGDDIIFVLSKYFSDKNEETIIHSSDHDFWQTLMYPNVKFWRTTRTQGMENSEWCTLNECETKDEIQKHVIQGDPGDGFGHIKHYSRFSNDFLEVYPKMKGKEKEAYPKRFKIEKYFEDKHNKKAYNHPRFGYKSFKKSGKSVEDLLNENEIYRWNYEMNKKLALPEFIPVELRKKIIETYKTSNNKQNYGCLYQYLMKYNLFEVTSSIINL